MTEVDARLKEAEVPIFARPLQAISIVCQKGGFSLALGAPLAERIHAWFDAQYGERIEVDLSLGYGPVVIRGDLYEMRSPWLIAGGQIICTARKVEPSGAIPIVNVLEFIAGLTDQRANDLTTGELEELLRVFTERQGLFADIRGVQNDGAFAVALGDLRSAADYLLQDRPQLGSAKWACLQAVEKFLKGWIRKKQPSFKKLTHTLSELNDAANSVRLPRVPDADLAAVQCSPGVRYGESRVSAEEVVAAFNAALRSCAFIAREVMKSGQGSDSKVRKPEPNALTRAQFLCLKAGDLLRSGSLYLTVTGVAKESPRSYRTLVSGAIRETMIVEDDFTSFALVR